jgi:hypothetical protein
MSLLISGDFVDQLYQIALGTALLPFATTAANGGDGWEADTRCVARNPSQARQRPLTVRYGRVLTMALRAYPTSGLP